MKKSYWFGVVLVLVSSSAWADLTTLSTPVDGDAMFYWNSKYGYDSYTTGTTDMGVQLQNNSPYGIDYVVSIFEVPITSLVGKTVSSATLTVESNGFSTGYYYGSAAIGWLDVGAKVLTGNVVNDGLGAPAKARPGGLAIWNSDWGTDGAGTKNFNVLSYVLADLAAGRSYSTFVMTGSRDTYGSIKTAESGDGPRIVAVVPEPATLGLLVSGLTLLALRRRHARNA